MTTNVIPFEFEQQSVRIIDRDGEPWFVLADVCRVLEIGNPSQAASRLDDDEKDTLTNNEGIAATQVQALSIVNESGLYSLILTSRKPAAKKFKKWVTAEVLPTIRKTGAYGVPSLPDLSDPVVLQTLLTQHVAKRIEAEHRAEAAEKRVQEAQPKTAFFDRFVNSEGLYGLQNAARVLGQSPNKFIGQLKQGYLFYQGGALVPKVEYRERGIFEVKATEIDGRARYQTYVTPKGIEFFSKKFSTGTLFGPG